MNILQFAVWGAYLISMGRYLAEHGLGAHIGIFYAMQGIVSIFMPALMGIVADRWIPAQRLLGLCHLIAAACMITLGFVGLNVGGSPSFADLFPIYSIGVAFYMPTLGLSNSVAYTGLEAAELDTIKAFPPIRIFGTIGFIVSMVTVNLLGYQATEHQFFVSGLLGILLFAYSFVLPQCPTAPKESGRSLSQAFGLEAFKLLREPKMAMFFIFSMLLGINLQITNAYANPYLGAFGALSEYASSFGVKYSNILISISQVSETVCILLIPYFLRRFGIKKVMLIAMFCWVLRFAFLGIGNPGSGVWLFVLSMLVYGMAFDFFNVSGSLFVDRETSPAIRSSAQGLFILMTNGFGATIGTLAAQWVVNYFVQGSMSATEKMQGWSYAWYTFALYALVVMVLFQFLFRYNADRKQA